MAARARAHATALREAGALVTSKLTRRLDTRVSDELLDRVRAKRARDEARAKALRLSFRVSEGDVVRALLERALDDDEAESAEGGTMSDKVGRAGTGPRVRGGGA